MRNFALIVFFLLPISLFSYEEYSEEPNWVFGHACHITFNTADGEPVFVDKLYSDPMCNGATIDYGRTSISNKDGKLVFYSTLGGVYNEKGEIIKDGCSNLSKCLFRVSEKHYVYVYVSEQKEGGKDHKNLTFVNIFITDNDTITSEEHFIEEGSWVHPRLKVIRSNTSNKFYLISMIGNWPFDEMRSDKDDTIRVNLYVYKDTIFKQVQHFELYMNGGVGEINYNSYNNLVAMNVYMGDMRPENIIMFLRFDVTKGLSFIDTLSVPEYSHNNDLEFSPNGDYLYYIGQNPNGDNISSLNAITGLNKIKNGPLKEQTSRIRLLQIDSSHIYAQYASIKTGPNNKIYIANYYQPYLSSIENPNNINNIGFIKKSVDLKGNLSYSGLPATVCTIYEQKDSLIVCAGDSLQLAATLYTPYQDTIYSWTGPNNFSSNEANPVIFPVSLSDTGVYKLTVYNGDSTESRTGETYVKVLPDPPLVINISPDTIVCNTDVAELSVSYPYKSFAWSTGDTVPAILIYESGTYSVTVTNENGCISYGEIEVTFGKDLSIEITGDTLKCVGEAVTLTCEDEYPKYEWSNGATTRSITVTEPKSYTLTVTTEEGCKVERTITVRDYPEVRAELNPTPTTICNGDSTLLQSKYDVPYYSYEWNTGDTTRGIYVSKTGTYTLTITDTRTGCTNETEIAIKVEDNLKPTIEGSNICSGESATLTALPNDPSYSYEWSNGETTPVIVVTQPGTYSVTVSKDACSGTAEFTVNESPAPEFEILGENIICNTETATLTCSKDFAEYYWSTNEVTKSIKVTEAGTYTLTVTDANGCSATKSFTVNKYELKFDISKGSIDFGKVYITETKSDKTTITNHSGFEIKLANGQLVADGQSYPFNYDFVPTQLGVFSDKITLHITEPCDTVITIPITARVYARTTISTEVIYTQIGRTETVPVYLQCEADLPSQEYTITTDIDRSAFNTQDSYMINQDQPINKTKTKIHQLTGTILLSDKLEYDITFPNYSFTNPYIEVIEEPGKIYIDSVCIFPYRNVLFSKPTTLETNPNPATDELNISITTGVQGAMKLELVSTEGRVIYTDTWQQFTRSKELQINTRAIPSGLYQIRLITPIDAVTKNVVVVE